MCFSTHLNQNRANLLMVRALTPRHLQKKKHQSSEMNERFDRQFVSVIFFLIKIIMFQILSVSLV